MRAVVSDTSPLIYLTRLGHLEWLRMIYGDVILPQAVWDEVTIGGAQFPESQAVQEAVAQGWIQVLSPTAAVPGNASGLDPGEREAVALAKELNAVLIIDEMAGRTVARQLGLEITGTAGVLLAGKLRGLTSSLQVELDRLHSETTFWLSDDLRDDLLRQASELQ